MGRVIRTQRKGRSSVFRPSKIHKKGPSRIPTLSKRDCEKGIVGTVKEIMHEPGRGAPLVSLHFSTPEGEKTRRELIVAAEGIFSGQKILCGKNVPIEIANILPLHRLPEGIAVCSVEQHPGDGGKFARASGEYATVIGHDEETGTTRIKLPSGAKKAVSSKCCAVVGMVAGGARTDKPLLKAGRAFHKYKAKGRIWPRVRGVAMNPVDHPHGGGNHQHIGHPSTVSRHAPPGQKVGLVAARRTGLIRGKKKLKNE
ncbi:MAG: 60S ribosomal protein L2/L8 [Amphiamblys sp. WSBS2006]|nr:MAG: 60S ribosomal protein L2/L8 [Amphiamblys sp. WSBS2006]